MVIPHSTQSTGDALHDARQRLLRVREHLQRLCQSLDEEIRQLDASRSQPQAGQPPSPALFDLPPLDGGGTVRKPGGTAARPPPMGKVILNPAIPMSMEPGIEEETLDELNAALNRAFNEVTRRAA